MYHNPEIDISQNILIQKVEQYLALKKIDKKLQKNGYCNGLTIFWLYCKSQKKDSLFYDLIYKIATWDGIQDLDIEFEKFLNNIEWYQTAHHYVFDIHQNEVDKILTEVVDVTNAKTVFAKSEFSLPFLFKKSELIETLNEIIFENKFILCRSSNHTIGIIKKDQKFILYDTNNKKGEVELTSVEALVNQIQNCFQPYLQSNSSEYMPLDLTVFDNLYSKPASYPYEPVDFVKRFFTQRQNSTSFLNKYFWPYFWPSPTSGNEIGWNNTTALHFAANFGDEKLVNFLLAKKVNLFLQNNTGNEALHLAIEQGHDNIVQTLLKNGADIHHKTKSGNLPLHIAAQNGFSSLIDPLSTQEIIDAPNGEGHTALHLAIAKGHIDVIEKLIAKNADVDAKILPEKWSLLHLAIIEGRYDIVKILVDAGATINEQNKSGVTPLNLAINRGLTSIAELLIMSGANVLDPIDQFGNTYLHLAARKGNSVIIETLINAGASLDQTNNSGKTAFHIAIEKGQNVCLAKLMQKGANTNQLCGQTNKVSPLKLAYQANNQEAVKILLEKKVLEQTDTSLQDISSKQVLVM